MENTQDSSSVTQNNEPNGFCKVISSLSPPIGIAVSILVSFGFSILVSIMIALATISVGGGIGFLIALGLFLFTCGIILGSYFYIKTKYDPKGYKDFTEHGSW